MMNNSGHELPQKNGASQNVNPAPQELSLERIHGLIHDLEQELAHTDIPQAQDVRKEIDTLKQMLAAPDEKEGRVREKLHGVHNTLQEMTATVEGEVLKDSPYIAEMGRILGLV